MRVEATARRGVVARPGASAGSAKTAAAFTVVVDNDAPASGAPTTSPNIDGLGALLALQGAPDPMSGRRRSMRRGVDLLDQLDGIKLALLEGRVGPERLERLAATLADREPTGDSRLDGVLAEIDLRARVELAKLGKFAE